MKHTPGPWEVFWIASPAGTSARIFSDATEPATDIAHIPMEWNGDGSNARLMAAAPRMAVMLRDYVYLHDEKTGSECDCMHCVGARALLDKVEGES